MARFRQAFFKPGRYHVGGGVFKDFTADDVRAYINGTRKLLKESGLGVAVIAEHADPGSEEGAPRSRRDERADMVRNTVGWLEDLAVGDDGTAYHVLNIADAEEAKKMASGLRRFTSPELRRSFTDGKGATYENIISHVALTNRPRNSDQTAFVPVTDDAALQFSLEDFSESDVAKKPQAAEVVQLSDDEKEKPDGPPDEQTEESPSEAVETPAEEEKPETPEARSAIEQLVSLLDQMGLKLGTDTDKANIVERLTVAVLTKLAHEQQSEEEEEVEAKPGEALVEDKPPLQFSLGDLDNCPNKLLAKVIRQDHDKLKTTLDKFPPVLRDALLAKEEIHQFSAEGDRLPLLTVSEVAGMIEDAFPEGFGLQFSAAVPADGPAFNDNMTEQRAQEIIDKAKPNSPTLRGGK